MKKSWQATTAALLLLPLSPPVRAQSPSTPKDADGNQPVATLTSSTCDGKHVGTAHWDVVMPNKDAVQLDAKRGKTGIYDLTFTVPPEYKTKSPPEAIALTQSVFNAAGPSYYDAEKACGTPGPTPPKFTYPPKIVFAEAKK